MSTAKTVKQLAAAAAAIAPQLAASSIKTRNGALQRIQHTLHARQEEIATANRRDVRAAEQQALAAPLLKRLHFQQPQIATVCSAIDAIIALPDPLGTVLERRLLDTDLKLYRKTVPIGVIGVIFESRPDALVQIAALCLKSGNCCLMKGGSEAEQTNRLLADVIIAAASDHEQSDHATAQRNGSDGQDHADVIPRDWLTALTTRDEIAALVDCADEVNLIIPRGSNEFVQSIMRQSAIPVLGHADGVCHIYIDSNCDERMAEAIVIDAKTQYPAVCNATECLLVHQQVAERVLPPIAASLLTRGVTLYGCPRSRALIPNIAAATEQHWGREYLSLELSIKVVESLNEAIAHINKYGSKHTDAIITDNDTNVEQFMRRVDSSSVLHNCSTRFSDGYRYGLGAEVGISTAKIHARGPVGLAGLLTYKWHLYGAGHLVADYSGTDGRRFLHAPLT